MTATSTAATAEELVPDVLREEQREQVPDANPEGRAPQEEGEQYVRSGSLGRRVHDIAFLSFVAALQLGWLAALVYWLWPLV